MSCVAPEIAIIFQKIGISASIFPSRDTLLFAVGRRTVSGWLRAGGLSDDYQDSYYFLSSLGRKAETVANCLLDLVRSRIAPEGRVRLALDDTVTKRFGPHVEGAGIHRNPTPGPADQTFVYGHVWVTLSWIVRHPLWGTIGLPLLAKLYVRAKDVWLLSVLDRWTFRTKLELAAELVEWAARRLRWWKLSLWVVVDGGYTKRPFLRRATAAGAVVVGRLRKDAALRSVPKEPAENRRGRPRKYGPRRISLAKRAAPVPDFRVARESLPARCDLISTKLVGFNPHQPGVEILHSPP